MIPKNRQPNHPGEILRDEFLIPLGLTQTALAGHMGWSHARVNEIIHGRRGISSEAALSLADAFGTTPDLWMNLQANYDLYKASRYHRKKPVLAKASEPLTNKSPTKKGVSPSTGGLRTPLGVTLEK